MSTFEDQLWSQLVSDHGDQIRQAGKATASLAASVGETGASGYRWAHRGQPSRWSLAVAATTFGVACLAGAIIATVSPTHNSTAPAISRAAFVVTDNHDGTVNVTLRKRSALPVLNATLARYGLKAKLPSYASSRTLSLAATCPTAPKLPTKGHPLRLVPAGSQHAPSRLPGTPRPLRFCELHTT
jgi:hypothetical protein